MSYVLAFSGLRRIDTGVGMADAFEVTAWHMVYTRLDLKHSNTHDELHTVKILQIL